MTTATRSIPVFFIFAAMMATASCATAAAPGAADPRATDVHLPIVFVHGNGGNESEWDTTMWRFESNGWPSDRLFTFSLPYPLAGTSFEKDEPGRSSAAAFVKALSDTVDSALEATGAHKVILIGSSRGGWTIRNYVLHGGAPKVEAALLGGTANHGVFIDPAWRIEFEGNGAGAFLTSLNTQNGPNGDEVTPGVRWLMVRSDGNDVLNQADGAAIGRPGWNTGLTPASAALRGAVNKVLAGADHAELSFGTKAFVEDYLFLTGRKPESIRIVAERRPLIEGTVLGLGFENIDGDYPNNLALAGAKVSLYALDPSTGARRGAAILSMSTGADGHWGPVHVKPGGSYEFVVAKEGYAEIHFYRHRFLRSSRVINLQMKRRTGDDAVFDGSIVTLSRLHGFLGVPRNRVTLDGKSPPPDLAPGIPSTNEASTRIGRGAGRAITGAFDGEIIVGRTWSDHPDTVVELDISS